MRKKWYIAEANLPNTQHMNEMKSGIGNQGRMQDSLDLETDGVMKTKVQQRMLKTTKRKIIYATAQQKCRRVAMNKDETSFCILLFSTITCCLKE